MSNRPNQGDEAPLELIAETENYAVLTGEDDEGERIYNVELGNVTLHLFREEWDELVQLIRDAARK
jgi:hypothetical protein